MCGAFAGRLWSWRRGRGSGSFGGPFGLSLALDFLDIHAYGWRWPTFNLADSFLFVGVVLILLASRRPLPEPAR